MNLQDLQNVKKELKRFEDRLDACIIKVSSDSYALYGCKETGAVKRAALDLKNELTKMSR